MMLGYIYERAREDSLTGQEREEEQKRKEKRSDCTQFWVQLLESKYEDRKTQKYYNRKQTNKRMSKKL